MTVIFASLLLLLQPALCAGQANLYTKKMLLEDFTNCTTKIILSGDSPLELAVKGEVASRWHLSPYEFSTVEEYNKLVTNNSFYFLRLVAEDGVAFLQLSKGGKEDDADRKKRPLEVVRLPISLDGMMTGDEAIYMGAYLDIIQNFTEQAMESDRVAYAGLSNYNLKSLQGKTVYLNDMKANEAFQSEEAGAVVPVLIVPVNGATYYKMLIAADTHELLYFSSGKINKNRQGEFSKAEISQLTRRHAVVVE